MMWCCLKWGRGTKSSAVHGADLDFSQFQLPSQRGRRRRGRPYFATDVSAVDISGNEQQRRQSATQRGDAAQQTADISVPSAQPSGHGDSNSAGSVGVDHFSQSTDARRVQQSIGQYGAHGLPLRFTAVVEQSVLNVGHVFGLQHQRGPFIFVRR